MTKESILQKLLTPVIVRAMQGIFEKKPDARLSETGFKCAWVFAMQKLWPDMSAREASRELPDYMPDPYGHPAYPWSYSMAKEMAQEYVNEFGERVQ